MSFVLFAKSRSITPEWMGVICFHHCHSAWNLGESGRFVFRVVRLVRLVRLVREKGKYRQDAKKRSNPRIETVG
ncbi:MAG: hypothetical protein JSU77_10175 [Fidelibacterota bacterium]|nr:MAG: hypothetical protein JSU77_10175 [Candidatus Neomarinimicrobiota bacterium]